MRLFRSEVLRARSRRLVPMVLIFGLLAVFVGLGLAAIFAEPPTQAQIDDAQQRYEQNVDRCMKGRFGPQSDEEVPPGFDSLEDYCRETSGPFLENAGVQLRDLPVILQGTAMFVILFGALLGASLAGADWTNDTMTTLLTWEPRRVRVFLIRGFVIVLFILAITLLLQVAFSAVYALVASTRGTTAFQPSDLWSDTAATALRVSAMAVAIGLVAYAIAMIGRSTVSSLGALFGYVILFEGVIAGFFPKVQSWLLGRAVGVVVSQAPILEYNETAVTGGRYPEPTVLMDVSRAWTVVGVYVVVLMVLSLILFRRRDVT